MRSSCLLPAELREAERELESARRSLQGIGGERGRDQRVRGPRALREITRLREIGASRSLACFTETSRTRKRPTARQELVEDASEGEDIRALIGVLSREPFGRLVADGAADVTPGSPGAALAGFHETRAKIEDERVRFASVVSA